MATPGYTLRTAAAVDLESMMRIAHEGLRPYVEELWGWDQVDQERGFRESFRSTGSSVIQVKGEDVGFLNAEHHTDHVYLSGVYLQADMRNQGLGARIVGDLQRAASESGRFVRLQVLRPNPARRLYERLGFRPVDETLTHTVMEWMPT